MLQKLWVLTLTLVPTWSPLALQGTHVLCGGSLAPLPISLSVFSNCRICMSVEACFVDLTANLQLFMYQQRWKDTRRIEERQKLNAERTWARDALVPCWPVLAQNHRRESLGFVHCVWKNGVRQLRNHTFPRGTEDLSCTASFRMAKQQGGGVHPGDPDARGLFRNPQRDTREEPVIGDHPARELGRHRRAPDRPASARPAPAGPE